MKSGRGISLAKNGLLICFPHKEIVVMTADLSEESGKLTSVVFSLVVRYL